MSDQSKPKAAPVISMTACKSSNISHHGYDATSKILAITFSSGTTYHYYNVPQEKIDALGKCKSVGSFFATDIRNAFKGVKQEAKKS
jgi:hypothetical protein